MLKWAAGMVVVGAMVCAPAMARDIERGSIGLSGDMDLSLTSGTQTNTSGVESEHRARKIDVSGVYYVLKNIGVDDTYLWSL